MRKAQELSRRALLALPGLTLLGTKRDPHSAVRIRLDLLRLQRRGLSRLYFVIERRGGRISHCLDFTTKQEAVRHYETGARDH